MKYILQEPRPLFVILTSTEGLLCEEEHKASYLSFPTTTTTTLQIISATSSNMAFEDPNVLVPDVSEVSTPLRAESLRQLEEEEGPLRREASQGEDIDEDLDESLSSATPPTTTDESYDDDDDTMHAEYEEAASMRKALAPPKEGGKVVLVTGGAGFVGSHVADHLLTRGDSVIIVDEFNEYYDVTLKRSNIAYLIAKHGTNRLRIVEVRHTHTSDHVPSSTL